MPIKSLLVNLGTGEIIAIVGIIVAIIVGYFTWKGVRIAQAERADRIKKENDERLQKQREMEARKRREEAERKRQEEAERKRKEYEKLDEEAKDIWDFLDDCQNQDTLPEPQTSPFAEKSSEYTIGSCKYTEVLVDELNRCDGLLVVSTTLKKIASE